MAITDEELQAVNGYVDPDGILWAVPIDGGPHIMVATPRGINPEYRHIIQAALMMYKTLSVTNQGYDKIIAYGEAIGDQQFVGHILQLQAAVIVTLRCAIEGLDAIARNSEKRD